MGTLGDPGDSHDIQVREFAASPSSTEAGRGSGIWSGGTFQLPGLNIQHVLHARTFLVLVTGLSSGL